MTDLHMGIRPQSILSFSLVAVDNPNLAPAASRRVKEPRNTKVLAWIWQRRSDTARSVHSDSIFWGFRCEQRMGAATALCPARLTQFYLNSR